MVKHLPINGAEYYRTEISYILDKIQYCKDFLGINHSVGREWKVTLYMHQQLLIIVSEYM